MELWSDSQEKQKTEIYAIFNVKKYQNMQYTVYFDILPI